MLFLLFVLVPLIELALLIQVGQWIGAGWTLLLVLGTGAAGAALARREGLRTLRKIQGEMAAGRVPGGALLDGAAILLGGAFLLTPGVLTDLVGLGLLFPPTRALARRWIRAGVERRVQEGSIQVTMMGGLPGGMPGAGSGPGAGAGRSPDGAEADPVELGLDPRNEIRVDDGDR